MIILRLLLLLTNLHLKLLSTQGTGADKLLSTQRVLSYQNIVTLTPVYDEVNILNTFRVMIILRLLLLLTNLHLKLLSTQGTGADKLLSTQRVKEHYCS